METSLRQLILVNCFCWLFLQNPVSAQWVQTAGPEGGLISNIYAYQDQHFLISSGGLYRSSDLGLNWVKEDQNIEGELVRAILETPNYFFLMAGNLLYRSGKTNLNWTLVYDDDRIFNQH